MADLNLIRVFMAIWELRSLTAAAERLFLTQPAVSHALRRLREQFDDPLFFRVGHEMTPTESARRLHEPFSRALELIDSAVRGSAVFEPALARRVFRIAMSDIAEYCYLAALLGRLRQVAPGVRMAVVRLEPATIEASLRTGEVDLALGYLPDLSGCSGEQVLVDSFVGLIRAGHPFADDHLDASNIADLEYVRIDSGAPGHQMAERYLDQLGLQRQIGLRLAHITVTPEIIRQTEFAVIYPRSMAERINDARAFRILPLRLEMPHIEIRVHTHARASADPGIQWFSRTLTEVCQA